MCGWLPITGGIVRSAEWRRVREFAAGVPGRAAPALLNLIVTKVSAGEGLGNDLVDRADSLEGGLPLLRLHDTADLCRGLWSRYVEDLGTARAALYRCIARARDAGDDFAQSIFLSYLSSTEELAGDFAAAVVALDAADAAAAWHDWTPSAFHLEPRCQQLIAPGDLDGAIRVAGEFLPDSETMPVVARYKGALVRMVSRWHGDSAGTVSELELAAGYADEMEWADPGVRDRLDPSAGRGLRHGGPAR
jgi:hypothetical protein